MSRHRILELGAGPADEPCAQLGQCADFAEANTLELLAYKAAIIALNCEPPLPLGFALIANAHDFGTYRTLWLVSADLPLPEDAQVWLACLVEPVSWVAAGFPAPVTYEGSHAVMRSFREVIAAALQITRPNADGSFFPAENAVLHRNLLAAYGPATVTAADSG
jgi:hypothetical protein